MTLEQAFQRQALTNAQAAMTLHGAPTKRLVQTLELRGGVETGFRPHGADSAERKVRCLRPAAPVPHLRGQRPGGDRGL